MEIKNRTWLIVVVLFRVFLTLGIVMALFLGMWVGYFTIPLIVIGVFSFILVVSDISILFTLRKKDGVLSKKTKQADTANKFIDEKVDINRKHE